MRQEAVARAQKRMVGGREQRSLFGRINGRDLSTSPNTRILVA